MKIAIIIPCFNEELTIAKVIRDCRNAVPQAEIHVFDNNSIDHTRPIAQKAGAHVHQSTQQGKGHVIRHAFRKVSADYYVMIDGDDTYPAEYIPRLLEEAQQNDYDMLIGTRLKNFSSQAFRGAHYFGNQFFSNFVSMVFNFKVNDIFSGYRVFNNDFVKNVCLVSRGFEIETELTLQAISMGWSLGEMPIPYRNRPAGSFSKLKTFQDGFSILKFIFNIIRDYKPLQFFSYLSFSSFLLSLAMGWTPIQEYIEYAYVYTVPRSILAASLMILATVFLGVGLILDSQRRYLLSHAQWLKNFQSTKNDNLKNSKSA